MTPKEVFEEIKVLTSDLIKTGLCIDQNFPVLNCDGVISRISFGKTDDLSISLKNIPYSEAFDTLLSKRVYNIKMIDGGLIQLLYQFDEDRLSRHRLAFFPSPNLLEYQNNSDIYEDDDLYADVIKANVVTVPIRFDYDPNSAVDYLHPACHLTLGQYQNCRVPVCGGLTPFLFLNFILRSFYNTPYRRVSSEITVSAHVFARSITDSEKQHIHLVASGQL